MTKAPRTPRFTTTTLAPCAFRMCFAAASGSLSPPNWRASAWLSTYATSSPEAFSSRNGAGSVGFCGSYTTLFARTRASASSMPNTSTKSALTDISTLPAASIDGQTTGSARAWSYRNSSDWLIRVVEMPKAKVAAKHCAEGSNSWSTAVWRCVSTPSPEMTAAALPPLPRISSLPSGSRQRSR